MAQNWEGSTPSFISSIPSVTPSNVLLATFLYHATAYTCLIPSPPTPTREDEHKENTKHSPACSLSSGTPSVYPLTSACRLSSETPPAYPLACTPIAIPPTIIPFADIPVPFGGQPYHPFTSCFLTLQKWLLGLLHSRYHLFFILVYHPSKIYVVPCKNYNIFPSSREVLGLPSRLSR